MTQEDLDYVDKLLDAGVLSSPVLELGVGYGGSTSRTLIESRQLCYYGTDLELGPTVDFVADFEREDQMGVFKEISPFGTILVLNVLEHTFDPIAVLDNCFKILRLGGALVLITPTVWALHNYPVDTYRINPNLYEEYARRNAMKLLPEHFQYIGHGLVSAYRSTEGSYRYPPPSSALHWVYSRIIHKAANTAGRGMHCPSCFATAAVLVK